MAVVMLIVRFWLKSHNWTKIFMDGAVITEFVTRQSTPYMSFSEVSFVEEHELSIP